MNIKKIAIQSVFLFFSFYSLKAQENHEFIFGKFSVADFNPQIKNADSAAGAVIIADIEKVHFEYNDAGTSFVIYKHFSRIKILKEFGLSAGNFRLTQDIRTPYHIALVKVPDPGLFNLKGTTYNLENGRIATEQLDLNSVSTINEGKVFKTEKFTMPALKAGSVFDVEYSVRRAFELQDLSWSFQNKFPCLWSEYDLALPDANKYVIKYQGDTSFYLHSVETPNQITDEYSSSEHKLTTYFKWVKINEDAIVEEPYMSSLKNYEDRISLEHDWIVFNRAKHWLFNSTDWVGFSNIYFTLNQMEDFPEVNHNWLKRDLRELTTGLISKNDIAVAIYHYVRDSFVCVEKNSYFASQTLKETFKDKSGNVADLNLLLSTMLRQEKIEADPAVLSTTDNGFGNLISPLPNDYNYLICVVRLDGKNILLDASQPFNSFGKISPLCYNGGTIALNPDSPRFILLLPDSLTESNSTNIIIKNEKPGKLSGKMTEFCGIQRSYTVREQIKKTSLKNYFDDLLRRPELKGISNEEISELKYPDKSIIIRCDLNFKDSAQSDLFYFKPVIFPFFETNPFASNQRRYLIEMPYKLENNYSATMQIPDGYTVEEMPASESFQLNSDQGNFEYSIENKSGIINVHSKMKLNKTFFPIDQYGALREFFNNIIKKQNQQIVFRKLK